MPNRVILNMVRIVPKYPTDAHDVCSIEELMALSQKAFRFRHPIYGLHEIAIFWHESRVYAMQGSCPHQGANLAYGHTAEGTVTCPLHHAAFALHSGQCLDGFTDDTVVYEALIIDGRVLIVAPEESLAP